MYSEVSSRQHRHPPCQSVIQTSNYIFKVIIHCAYRLFVETHWY